MSPLRPPDQGGVARSLDPDVGRDIDESLGDENAMRVAFSKFVNELAGTIYTEHTERDVDDMGVADATFRALNQLEELQSRVDDLEAETADLEYDRLESLLVNLLERLTVKGHDVDARSFARAACEAFDQLPHIGGLGSFQEDPDPFWNDRPTCANDVFAAAVEAGVAPVTEAIVARSSV